MRTCESLRRSLSAGECDQTLASLYALDGADSSLAAARARALRAVEEFQSAFSPAEDTAAALFSGPGRTEVRKCPRCRNGRGHPPDAEEFSITKSFV